MARILSVWPDATQSATLRHALAPADAEIRVVGSIDDALTAIDSNLPDLVLLDTFVPPREVDNLIAYLRILSNAGHVQVIFTPLIQPALDDDNSFQPRRGRQWLNNLFVKDSSRREVHPVAGDPHVFAADVAAYLSRSHTIRTDVEHANARHKGRAGLESREAHRWSPDEVSIGSAVRLAETSADLINLSSGGALVRTDNRPDARLRSQSALTFYLPSGEEIHQTGRLIRCHVTSIANTRFLYDVAFRFDNTLALRVPTSQTDLPNATVGEVARALTRIAPLHAGRSVTRRS